jgi:predicted HAD superfamily phosphohydrolase YqeG
MGVSVMVDVQNTLVNTMMKKYSNQEQKEKYLTRLATESVSLYLVSTPSKFMPIYSTMNHVNIPNMQNTL